ncbi:MAG: amino acid ABC transporter permease [Hyphomicrobiales bacterium]|nr:amino acid ABC transporter permease [Hyphomicrobiales bacterium]
MAVQDVVGPDRDEHARVPLLYDPKIRALAAQVLLILAVVWFGYEIVSNTVTNLAKQNIATGVGFLSNTAGFGVVATLGTWAVGYVEESSYGAAFLVGLINTLAVAVVGIVFATILGFILGVARLSPNWIISRLATLYVEVLRNIPLLLQIFFWYFAVLRSLPSPRQSLDLGAGTFINSRGMFMPMPVPEAGFGATPWAFLVACIGAYFIARWARKRQYETGQQFPIFWTSVGLIIGVPLIVFLIGGAPLTFEVPVLRGFNFQGGMVLIPEYVALLLALTLYTATFIAEIVRAGILAVSHGQTEAAHALGLRGMPTLRLVIIPQAMRVIIPPLTNQYLNLTKNSSLAVAIAYPDLVSVFAGTTLNQTGQAVEVLLITMAVYLTLSILTSLFMNWYNARMALVER